MDLSIKPGEMGDLAKLLYGQGAAASPDSNTPPANAQPAPSGPVDANTQNPIPNNQGFYDLVAGNQPAPAQPQAPQAAPAQPQAPANAASQPVAVSTPQGQ